MNREEIVAQLKRDAGPVPTDRFRRISESALEEDFHPIDTKLGNMPTRNEFSHGIEVQPNGVREAISQLEHRAGSCGLVVCSEHDWAECAAGVVGLQSTTKQLDPHG